MKFTLNWLKEYLNTNSSCCEICEKLNQIGLEVEELIDNGESLKDFSCVLVEECESHPNSDHLHICKVKRSNGEILKVVCGAPNVRKGLKTILAPIGSVIPNGNFRITKSKIRGEESCGMLCSESELGISDNQDGIIELSNNTELGKNITEILALSDPVIEINITPNRGDCLGVYGIARDLSATNIGILKEFKNYEIKATEPSPIKIEIKDENCSEFLFRYISNVKNCESPDWMKEKLKAVGINPKSALVDISNYVMLILNRPLHCYDADKIEGNIVVKKSNGDEKFLALDKNEYILNKNATLICDTSENILGLGGIIGGNNSSSSLNTKNIILECAIFESVSIATTSRYLNINTDAKFRFERGVDSKNGEIAINYATYLITSICGGKCSEIIKFANEKNFESRIIDFDISNVELILGLKIEREKIINILEKLGYKVKENNTNLSLLTLTIPNWRNDITIKENVIEDIIRIYDYNNLKEIKIGIEKVDENEPNIDNKNFHDKLWKITSLLASQGMTEVISWSFMNESLASEFSLINEKLRVKNPINKELSYMRPSIIPNLMTIAKYNQDRSIENISIFEKGKIFINSTPEGQKEMIAGIRIGLTSEKDALCFSRIYDIFDIKKDLFDILKIFGISAESLIITNDVPDYYHPSRSGAIKIGNIFLGVFGEIHPLKVNKIGLKSKVNAFELYIDNLPKIKEPKITQKKKFILNDLQPVYRDFAFIVDCNLEVGKIIDLVRKTNKELIKEVHIFDIYQGEHLENDKKSVAFKIKIQPVLKSLTTEEIDLISNKIISEIQNKYGAILRDK